MTNSGTGKKVVFTPNSMDIYDMQTNSRVSTGEVNHQSRLYTFSEFIEPDSALLLTHADESSRIWHERFGHLRFSDVFRFTWIYGRSFNTSIFSMR
jgi:hypothetical protein